MNKNQLQRRYAFVCVIRFTITSLRTRPLSQLSNSIIEAGRRVIAVQIIRTLSNEDGEDGEADDNGKEQQ